MGVTPTYRPAAVCHPPPTEHTHRHTLSLPLPHIHTRETQTQMHTDAPHTHSHKDKRTRAPPRSSTHSYPFFLHTLSCTRNMPSLTPTPCTPYTLAPTPCTPLLTPTHASPLSLTHPTCVLLSFSPLPQRGTNHFWPICPQAGPGEREAPVLCPRRGGGRLTGNSPRAGKFPLLSNLIVCKMLPRPASCCCGCDIAVGGVSVVCDCGVVAREV